MFKDIDCKLYGLTPLAQQASVLHSFTIILNTSTTCRPTVSVSERHNKHVLSLSILSCNMARLSSHCVQVWLVILHQFDSVECVHDFRQCMTAITGLHKHNCKAPKRILISYSCSVTLHTDTILAYTAKIFAITGCA